MMNDLMIQKGLKKQRRATAPRLIGLLGLILFLLLTATSNTAFAQSAPVLDPIPDTSIVEGDSLILTVTATDPDATTPALSAVNTPTNSTFIDNN
ncbi:MAG: hypothetical protein PVH24_05600, partial [Candidatus Zixiibacteriota bacterium]